MAEQQVQSVTPPDVATEPHPTTHAATPPRQAPDAASGVLQEALPEIAEAARKVGGYDKLAEIAGQLGEADAQR